MSRPKGGYELSSSRKVEVSRYIRRVNILIVGYGLITASILSKFVILNPSLTYLRQDVKY